MNVDHDLKCTICNTEFSSGGGHECPGPGPALATTPVSQYPHGTVLANSCRAFICGGIGWEEAGEYGVLSPSFVDGCIRDDAEFDPVFVLRRGDGS